MQLLKPSEVKFLGKIFLFFFGLSNIIPSKYSIYDKIILLIEPTITPENIFYQSLTLLILIFHLLRFVILALTFWELIDTIKYGIRYNVFRLKDLLTK
jgi:hypothetical protein